jgi:predicted RNase H-like nuclease (RuvC/YqgF family)
MMPIHVESPNGIMVKYSDYKHLSEYCDHLVEFSKLPCLPKDLQVLRTANHDFAIENADLQNTVEDLKGQIEGWENKWKAAVDMAARAQIERDDALKLREKWHRKWRNLRNESVHKIEAMKEKLDELLSDNIYD